MKKRKLLALLCAGMLAVGAFTACGNTADKTGENTYAASAATEKASVNSADNIAEHSASGDGMTDNITADTLNADTTTEGQMNTTTITAATALSDMAKDVVLSADNVKLIGRTYLDGDTLWTALSGAGAEFVYTGRKLEITFVGDGAAIADNRLNNARIGVYVNGERTVDEMLDEKEKTFTAFESDTAKTVTVQIIKLSECAFSTLGIKPIHIEAGEGIAPTAQKTHKIEIIGDSITCGYGVDDEVKEHHFSTETEDVTRAYSYKTAQKLGVDYSFFSISGYGIISGYTDDGVIKPEETIPQYYESLGFSRQCFAEKTAPQSVKWDFNSYKPDAILINLGTNDNSYCKDDEKKAVFQAAYLEFLKTVRKNNPDAVIICTLGLMGDDVIKNIELAIEEFKAQTGDEKISMFAVELQSESNGYAADWHPTEKSHEIASEVVYKQIANRMGW